MNLDPDHIPSEGEQSHRNTIAEMEKTIDTSNQLFLTSTLLSDYIDNISHAIDWLRSSQANTVTFKEDRQAVRYHLQKARIKFQTAHGQYNEKKEGQSEKFYNLVEEGRQELEKTLNAW